MSYVLIEEDELNLINSKLDRIQQQLADQSAESTEKIMDVREAAEYLHTTANTLYVKARANKIPHIKVGRRYFFDKTDLKAWGKVPVEE